MKTIILSLLITFTFTTCKAQNDHLNHVTHDKVKINNLFSYKVSPSTVISKIGNPISITSRYSELQDTNVVVYGYNGLKIDFINNAFMNMVIYDFEITNNTYSLFIDGLEIKVGDSINVIQYKFPKSFNERVSEGAAIIVHDRDAWISIDVSSNGIITKIENRSF